MNEQKARTMSAFLVRRELRLADPEVRLVRRRTGGRLDEDHLVGELLLDGEVDVLGRPRAPVVHGDGVTHLRRGIHFY